MLSSENSEIKSSFSFLRLSPSALSLPRGTLALGGPRREFFFSPLEAPNPLTNYSDLKKRQDLDQLVLQRVRVVRQW